jgi:hypothetical protein
VNTPRELLAETTFDQALFSRVAGRIVRIIEVGLGTLAVGLAAWITLLSLVYAFIAYPQADDLERTAAMRMVSPLVRVWGDYQLIDGRWMSLFIQYFCYRGEHVTTRYAIMLLIPLLIGLVGCCFAVSLVAERRVTEPRVMAGGMVIYAVLWVTVHWGGVFYWFPALMGYWLPIGLGMILLWLLTNVRGWPAWPPVIGLAVIIPALHEVCGGWIVMPLAVIYAIRFWRRWDGKWIAGAACLASVLSTASVVFAPALRRRADGSQHVPLADAFHVTLDVMGTILSRWPALVAVLLCVVLLAARSSKVPRWYAATPRITKLSLLLAAVAFPIGLCTAVAMALGGLAAARLYDGVFFLTAAAAATLACVLGFDLSCRPEVRRWLSSIQGRLLWLIVLAASIVGITQFPRYRAAYREVPIAIDARVLVTRRAEEVRAARDAGVRDVIVHEHIPAMKIIEDFELREDPGWVINQHLKSYFQVRSIRLAPQ